MIEHFEASYLGSRTTAFLLPVCTFAGIFVTLGLYKNKSSQTTKKTNI